MSTDKEWRPLPRHVMKLPPLWWRMGGDAGFGCIRDVQAFTPRLPVMGGERDVGRKGRGCTSGDGATPAICVLSIA